jgi:Flp pilus assembly protein TadD
MLARPYIVGWGGGSWFAAVPINLILGNKAFALMLIREAATTPMAPTSSAAPGEIDRMSIAASTSRIYSHNLLAKNFDLDPRMAPWRNDPDILALLRARPVGAAASASEGQAEPSLPPEAAALMARTRQLLDQPDGGPDNLALADTLMAQATDLAPDSPDAWSLRGYVQSAYVLRNLDRDGSRLKAVQDCCSQALALNPNQTEAMLGLAVILVKQGAPAQAEALMRRAIQLQPDDRRLSRELARDLAIEGGPAETPDSHAGAAGRQALP